MSSGNQAFNEALKELKKARKDLNKFNENSLLKKGFPRWIIIQQKEHLEGLIVHYENNLRNVKKSKNNQLLTDKSERNPYKS